MIGLSVISGLDHLTSSILYTIFYWLITTATIIFSNTNCAATKRGQLQGSGIISYVHQLVTELKLTPVQQHLLLHYVAPCV